MQSSTRATLCNLVEDNLTSLIREAATVQRHSRRARFRPTANAAGPTAGGTGGGGPLLPEGVDPNSPAAAALAGRVGAAPSSASSGALMAGAAGGGGPKRRRLLHADDINLALAHRGSEKLYLTNAGQIGGPTVTTVAKDEDSSSSSNNNSGNGSKKRKDAAGALTSVVDLNEYLKTEMTLRPPSEIGLRAHWLAVDGVQPDIPENPPPIGAVVEADDGPAGGMAGAGGGAIPQVGVGALRAYQQRDLTVHRVEDDEDLEAVAAAAGEDDKADSAGGGGGPSAASGGGGAGGVSVRQLLPRLLSEELRLYFTRITLAVERGNPAQVESALSAIGKDSGIQELVPFFVRFVSRQIYDNVGRVEYCRTLVRLAKKLVSNPHLHLELNLHQLLPPLITCVVARRLAGGDGGNHWALREEAAEVLMAACSTFGEQYTTLKARVLRTLCEALSPDMPLTTQYGGIVGISRFGPKAVDAFLLPLATSYWTRWEEALRASSYNDVNGRFEVQQCQRALLEGLALFMQSVSPEEQSERVDWDAMSEVFGERLIPLRPEPSEYVDCLV